MLTLFTSCGMIADVNTVHINLPQKDTPWPA
jgi:hypothetical protein